MARRVTSAGFGHETAQLQADDMPVRSRFASRSQIAFLAEEAFDGLERESNNWALYGGIGAGILACIGGTAFAMAGTKNSADQKEEEAREVVLGSQAAKNADMDAEKLVKTVAKRAVQMVGPKLAKANMVKGILEQHVYGSGPCVSMLGYETVTVGTMSAPRQAFWEMVDHNIPVLDRAKFAAIVGIVGIVSTVAVTAADRKRHV